MDILIKLLLAHCVADFALQWPAMLNSKCQHKFASPYLYLHGFVHFALSMLLIWDLSWLPAIAVISVTHTIIDGLKLTYTNSSNERRLFFLDQLAHIIIILAACLYQFDLGFDIAALLPNFWLHVLCLFFIGFPSSIFIQKFFSAWTLPEASRESLTGIGVYIGYLERFLIYVAVVTQQWSLVGFLIAAKSIFRFGDFNKADEKAYAEYLFVGTLFSMVLAICSGLLFLLLSQQPLFSI